MEYRDPLGPSYKFKFMQYKGDYQKIINSATKPNTNPEGIVNKFADKL